MATVSPKQLRSYHPGSPSDWAYWNPGITCSCSSFWWPICLRLLCADESQTTVSTLFSGLDSIQRVEISHFPFSGKVYLSISLQQWYVCSCHHLVDGIKTLTWMLVMFLQRYTTDHTGPHLETTSAGNSTQALWKLICNPLELIPFHSTPPPATQTVGACAIHQEASAALCPLLNHVRTQEELADVIEDLHALKWVHFSILLFVGFCTKLSLQTSMYWSYKWRSNSWPSSPQPKGKASNCMNYWLPCRAATWRGGCTNSRGGKHCQWCSTYMLRGRASTHELPFPSCIDTWSLLPI